MPCKKRFGKRAHHGSWLDDLDTLLVSLFSRATFSQTVTYLVCCKNFLKKDEKTVLKQNIFRVALTAHLNVTKSILAILANGIVRKIFLTIFFGKKCSVMEKIGPVGPILKRSNQLSYTGLLKKKKFPTI